MSDIHPTAQVSSDAKLGEGTRVGAYAIIEGNVVTGPNCEIHPHAMLRPGTRLGAEVKVHPFALVGGEPQHLKYRGEPTTAEVGDRTVLRESVTVHRGTAEGIGIGKTVVGPDCLVMAYSHVAHDCVLGSGVILANNVQIGGHAEVGDFVTIGGSVAIGQFLRVGSYSFLGGFGGVRKDFPPFLLGKTTHQGIEIRPKGINAIGLERRGFSEVTVDRLRRLYRTFFLKKGITVAQAIEQVLVECGDHEEVKVFIDFVRASKDGIQRA